MKYLLLAGAVTAADQLSKHWAEKKIEPGQRIELIENKLCLHNVRNSGAAMGLFSNRPHLLTALTALSSLNILRHFYKINKAGQLDGAYKFSLACLAGGAAGNLSDRVRRGYVTDFVQVGSGPVFNISDVFILLGAVVFMVKRLGKNE